MADERGLPALGLTPSCHSALAARRRPGAVGVLALVGGLAGIAAKAADESGVRGAADLGSYPAAWVLAVALTVPMTWLAVRLLDVLHQYLP